MIAQAKLFATEMLARVDRPGDPDLRRHGADGGDRDRALLARRPGRADLGRHQRDPAPHHQPRHPAPARGLSWTCAACCSRARSRCSAAGRPRAWSAAAPRWASQAESGRCTRPGPAPIAASPSCPRRRMRPSSRSTARSRSGSIRELAAIGAGGAVCHAAGFRESGGRGAELQEALIEAAGGMPVLGPNCYGTDQLSRRARCSGSTSMAAGAASAASRS